MNGTQGTRHVIGLDAGGTKTVGLLADEAGAVLRDARAGGGNLTSEGELGVEKVLFQVIDALDPPAPVAALCLGIAGADRPAHREVVHGVLARLGFRRRVRVVHDAVVALAAGAPDEIGIVIVAGTGSVAYGRDPDGRTARSGGWGWLLGDEASAFWLGHAAVRQGIRAADGRGPDTTLLDRIRRRVGVETPQDLADWFYRQDTPRTRVAELAGVVEEAAGEGDAAAAALLDQAADHLARAARAVAERLTFPQSFPLILAGGTFRACPGLVPRIEERLSLHPGLSGARVELLAVEPARGAVTLALRELAS
ncbi:MAG TPA: BadF/BadG/BcrA/BcrD ATPase family protein [Thermoanaerobaculia bacterium]|nr:BadF/BadG/BcrA/BcrD ATPase family protein [Thermoanaerobaculia bacterium]